jgi:hypothetical protein
MLPIFNRSKSVIACWVLNTPKVHRKFNPESTISRPYVSSQKSLKERFVSQESTRQENTRSTFVLWWLGALLFTGYLLTRKSAVEALSEDERVVSLGIQKPNKSISDPKSLGLIDDLKNGSGWYKTSQNSPFSVQIVDGQLIWKSFDTINSGHVKEIADFYMRLGETRALHINTGIHGSAKGEAAVDEKSGQFIVDDLTVFQGYISVSYHIVSVFSHPITHSNIPHIDILDAWCYSNQTKDFSFYAVQERAIEVERIEKGSISGKALSEYFGNLGYPSNIITSSVYEPLPELEKNIEESLKTSPLCYVRGIGGLGKSRVSYEIEQKHRKSIEEQKEKSSYLDTVYISLKSEPAKESFFQHVRHKVGTSNEITPPIDKYFKLLDEAAQAKNKKVFIVIDNVDSSADFEIFQKLYKGIKDHPQRFQLLVTGRYDLTDFFQNQNIRPEKSIIEIEKHCKNDEGLWKIFLKNFLEGISIDERKKAEEIITKKQNQDSILKLFEKSGYHTSFIVTLGNQFAVSHKLKTLSEDLQTFENRIDEILRDCEKLDDYGKLSEIIQVPLEFSDKKFNGNASKICNVLSLISNEPVRIDFIRAVVQKYYKNEPISGIQFNNILNHLHKIGVLNHTIDGEEGFLKLPTFYNEVIRNTLFKKKLASVDSLFTVVLEVIEEESKTTRSQERINENMMHLLTLFNNAKDLSTIAPTYTSVNQKIANYAAERLNQVNCIDFFGLYNYFLLSVPDIPGYLLDPVLDAYIRGRSTDFLLDQLSSNDITVDKLKSLNNLFVLRLSQNKNPEQIRELLKIHLKNNKHRLDDRDAQIIEKNLILTKDDRKLLCFFPQIHFHQISIENLQKAEKWKNETFTKGQKVANLSGKNLGDGLGLLVHFLLVETGVEEIDLSHNYLGTEKESAIKSVCTLLSFPGTLKTLRLSYNTLNNSAGRQKFNLLIEGLTNNASLEKLTLNNNSLGDEEIKLIHQALKHHPKIKYIELHSNKFSDTGLAYLEVLMNDNPNIRSITTGYAHWFKRRHDGTTKIERDSNNQVKRVK